MGFAYANVEERAGWARAGGPGRQEEAGAQRSAGVARLTEKRGLLSWKKPKSGAGVALRW